MDANDIQGLVFSGYAHLEWASYLLFRFTELRSAREWLGRVADEVTPGSGHRGDGPVNLNVALTHRGLCGLGVDEATLTSFPRPFCEGMVSPHRSRLLGDTGPNAPSTWAWGGSPDSDVDVLLMLFASDQDILDQQRTRWRELADAAAMEHVMTPAIDCQPLPGPGMEHFGYRDGISQPVLEGSPRAENLPAHVARWSLLKPGEIVLGYTDDYGKRAMGPTVDASRDPQRVLPDDPDHPGRRDLGRNGSYIAVRQLAQDVQRFRDFITATAARPERRWDPMARERLMAELLGRWPSGAPLVKAPEAPQPDLDHDNEFGYATHDPHGLACPIGAHIRRANPRDSLGPTPRKALRSANRHRILRRGRSYGPPFTPEAAQVQRGLMFLCLNSDLERQFEFVQHEWINNPNFGGLTGEPDPLVGEEGIFTEQREPVRRRIHIMQRFVTVQGGAYFFLPGLRALRYLTRPPVESSSTIRKAQG